MPCDTVATALTAARKVRHDILLNTTYEDGSTIISLKPPVDLSGIQIGVSGDRTGEPVKLVDDNLELFFGQKDDAARVDILDTQGSTLIPDGSRPLVPLPGKYEIVEALVSDLDHNALVPAINPATKGTSLPDRFALDQNYPNPSNRTTEICLGLPDAANDAASGVYPGRLQAGDMVDTKKMVSLK